ncbi:MAG: hypothetical protein WCL51_06350 [Bacteroidota bacterium]
MKKLIKCIFLLILLASSCKKDANNTITNSIIYGTIVDSVTGKPVEGVKILKIAYYLTGSNTIDTTLTTTTDNEGKYSLNVSVATVDADRIYFNAVSDRYCFNRISYTSGTINECNMRLVKWGYLKFYCKNTSPYNSYDDLWIDVITANGFDGYYTNFVGTNVDRTTIIKVIGNRSHELHWEITKNNISTNKYEEIYFTGGDTVSRSILY